MFYLKSRNSQATFFHKKRIFSVCLLIPPPYWVHMICTLRAHEAYFYNYLIRNGTCFVTGWGWCITYFGGQREAIHKKKRTFTIASNYRAWASIRSREIKNILMGELGLLTCGYLFLIHYSFDLMHIRDSGLVVWFSLWVREAPGSIPGCPRTIFFFAKFGHKAIYTKLALIYRLNKIDKVTAPFLQSQMESKQSETFHLDSS